MKDLRDYLRYDNETGKLFWIKKPNNKIIVGTEVVSKDYYGYYRLGFDYKRYFVHRVCWYLYYGEWPTKQLDHINRDKTDNRISNLREVDHRQNSHNRESFNGGSFFHTAAGKWVSRIKINKKTKQIGTFSSEDEARQAYSKFVEDMQHESVRNE